jgi:PhnB protein
MAEPENPPLAAGITPYITVRGAKDAAEFYRRAFGAVEIARMDAEDGKRLIHCRLRINGADLMMSDEFPEFDASPEFGAYGLGDGPRGVTLHLAVDDADTWWQRAVDAGATVKMPLADQFWGDRYGQLRDPFGHSWSIGAPVKK